MGLASRQRASTSPSTKDGPPPRQCYAPAERRADPYLGRVVLGRYLVEALLGSGPRRATYRGTDIVRDCPVLVQRSQGQPAWGRAQAAAALVRGLGVAPLVGLSTTLGELTAVFESRGQQSLQQLVGAGRLPLATCLSVAVDVASGLATAHARGVAHGKLGADEVWLHRGPSRTSAQIVGFGIQTASDEEWEASSGVFSRRLDHHAAPASRRPSDTGADLVQFGRLLTWLVQHSVSASQATPRGPSEPWWGCEALYGIADRCLSPAAPNARTVRRALCSIETRHHQLVSEREVARARQRVVQQAAAPPRRQRESQQLAKVIVEPRAPQTRRLNKP